MRRITMWITATLAAVAMLTSYQANVAGVTGKDEHHGPPGVENVVTDPAPAAGGGTESP